MNRHAKTAAAAVLLSGMAAVAEAPRADAAHIRDVGERVFAFDPGGEVSIDSQNGRIVIETWDRHEVRVQITREVRAKNDAQARALMKEITADVAVAPHRIKIESIYPKRREVIGLWDWIGRGMQATQIHYYVQVPKETSLDLETSNGEIRVSGLRGTLSAETLNGDVIVSAVRGSVDLGTTNGEIRMAQVNGPAEATTTNGSVIAEITAVPERGSVELSTTNGNVQLTLPKTLHANLVASTTNGRVNVGYPVTMTRMLTSKAVQGTIGGGGFRLHLQTTNGNIDVAPAGARAGR